MFNDEPASVSLTGPASGIESFCVEGTIDEMNAHAQWDGRWVIASPELLIRAELAMAVDDAFAEMPGAQPVVRRGRPEQLLQAMLVVCDSIAVAEFTYDGRRRVIAR